MSLGRFYVPDNPYVPITLQTFGVLFTSAALGARRGFSATGIYLLIGAAGHAGLRRSSGSGSSTFAAVESGRLVLGTTGGYLVGFLLRPRPSAALAQRGWDRRLGGSVGAMLMGTLDRSTPSASTWLALALDRSDRRRAAASGSTPSCPVTSSSCCWPPASCPSAGAWPAAAPQGGLRPSS